MTGDSIKKSGKNLPFVWNGMQGGSPIIVVGKRHEV
jgi:hypothetical protein